MSSMPDQHSNCFIMIDPECPVGKLGIYSEVGTELFFNYMPSGNEVSDTASANWEEVTVLGRSEPYRVFGSTASREVHFTFEFMAVTHYSETKRKVDWLRSLAYPHYSDDGIVYPPPCLFLSFGGLFPELLRVVLMSPSVSWKGPYGGGSEDPQQTGIYNISAEYSSQLETQSLESGTGEMIEQVAFVPLAASVDCTFTCVNEEPKGIVDVLGGW